ncbi:MAG: rhomboid family intramembrane serine protease [Desulfobacteraceae bacterium]|jgi:membrane associated rhomboid family serine protease|nr:MAG: rhomboid family intramembrane serine protease [Desulfobacteraceae bacterium]
MRYRTYQGFRLTPIWFLIILNLIIFIATTISRELIFLLGLLPAAFLQQPWTILTNLFVHSGLWHIFANMFTLHFFGSYLSRLVGDGRFLITYFGGGILGNILFILLGPPFSIAIGASGAVFALGGALTVMRPGIRVFIIPIPAPIPLWIAVIGGFVILSFIPFVAWQAHLGGLVFGLITGYFFRKRERSFF